VSAGTKAIMAAPDTAARQLGRLDAYAQDPRAYTRGMIQAIIDKLDRPTLVIAAADSPDLEAKKAMAAKLPHGRIEIIEHAGHALFVDQPARFDETLRSFLDQLQ
jgi:pimeloyl-ACP methyl ester carboxylesterase